MQNLFHKIVRRNVILILAIFAFGIQSKKREPVNLSEPKRSLVEKEREYLKNKPMSDDLKAIIDKYKKAFHNIRNKRQESAFDDKLYVVQDGNLVPFKNLQSEEWKHNANLDGYTVVPLVVPLNSQSKMYNGLNSIKKIETREDKVAAMAVAGGGPPASVLTLATQTMISPSPVPIKISESSSCSEETLNEEQSSDESKNEGVVLQKILQDIEGLMQYKHETGGRKEGVLCSINGSWVSEAAGMRFDIDFKPTTRKKFRINVADRIPPNEDGFLCDGNWTLFGELPFQHSGVVIVLAVHEKDKHLAVFIGECRVCEGSDTVTGTWLIGRSSRDCKDQKAAHKILSDLWKREQTHTLRKKHLKELGLSVNEPD